MNEPHWQHMLKCKFPLKKRIDFTSNLQLTGIGWEENFERKTEKYFSQKLLNLLLKGFWDQQMTYIDDFVEKFKQTSDYTNQSNNR